jgi:TRAP-type mannitol/chloroaromatic compound transport system permease large subunit/TRAP-type mannitol/chloroaromatic compound transport system permease small subunit
MAEAVNADELDITDELIAERRSEEPGQTPEDMTPWQRPIVATIDVLNLWVGRIICLLLIPLMLSMVFEVVSRKAFSWMAAYGLDGLAREWGLGPTLWVYDTSRMLGGVIFMAAAAYALMRGVHIRADFLFRSWHPRTQATVDASLYLLFYFPAMIFFFWVSLDYTLDAWFRWERASDSTLMAPLAPARTAMPFGAFMLILQGFPELFRAFHQMGKEREAKFLKILPAYIVILAIIFVSIFFPDVLPFADWWQSIVGGSGLFDLSKPTIGLLMLAAMLFSIFIGFPISFTLIFLAFTFGSWGSGSAVTFFLMTLQTNSVMLSDQLVAVPLFIFMGIMMEQAGLMERLFTSVQLMMSRTRGALYIAVLFVSMIFAAATGIVGASVTILGIMAAKTMNKSGYDVRLAAGTITAGGTLGILIPPSIMLIVLGPVLEVPVTDLFRAAIIPGIMLAVLYMVYAIGRCILNPKLGPILPPDEQPETSQYYFLEVVCVMLSLLIFIVLVTKGANGELAFFPLGGLFIPLLWIGGMFGAYRYLQAAKPGGFYFSELWYEFFMGLVPPTVLIAFALGSILAGWATPAEAAACGAFGSILLSLVYRKLDVSRFYDALIKTLEITVLIMFLVAASNFFGAVFSNLGTPKMLTELLLSMDLSTSMMLIVVMALIFLLGWPLEWVPIVLIIVPILVPLLVQLDVNLTWFAILVAVNLQTAWLSPPVALSAYFLKGVVPEWDLKDIYFGMMQFMVIQVIGLALIFIFPQIVLRFPDCSYKDEPFAACMLAPLSPDYVLIGIGIVAASLFGAAWMLMIKRGREQRAAN